MNQHLFELTWHSAKPIAPDFEYISILEGLHMNVEGLGVDLAKSSSPAFLVNDLVKIKNKTPVGHYRTPFYVRGKTGRIERILDEFINPEEEAYGKNVGSKVRLYRVSFAQQELWPEYHSASLDQLQIEISEHWLEPA